MIKKIAGFTAAILLAAVLAFIVITASLIMNKKHVVSNGRPLVSNCTLSKVSDVFKEVTPSMMRIKVFEGGKWIGTGSGFFVKTPGGIKIMTAGHMIPVNPGDYTYRGQVITDIQTFKVANFTMTVDKVDRGNDLALMDFTAANHSFFVKPLEIVDRVPPIGEVVLVVGAPDGYFPQGTIGFSSRLVELDNSGNPYLQTSARAAPGNSGGPVVDCDGRVVGLLLALADYPDDHQFAASFIRPGYIINQFINSK